MNSQIVFMITDVVLIIGIGFLLYYLLIVNRRQKSLAKVSEKTYRENESLKSEMNKLFAEKDLLQMEFNAFKNRLRSSSYEVDPRELKMGDVFFSDRNYTDLYSVLDIKNMSLRIENVSNGQKINIQYPFDMVGNKYYKVTNTVNIESPNSDFNDMSNSE